jgi:hypothetical protein
LSLDRKEARRIGVSVKGGRIKPDDVRALNHVREREKADVGLFISLEQPTSAMTKDALSAGFYGSRTERSIRGCSYSRSKVCSHGTQRSEHPDYEPDWHSSRKRKRKRT